MPANYGKLPLAFEINEGQSGVDVKFLSRGDGYTLFLTGDEAVLSFRGAKPDTGAVLRLQLPGANANAKVIGVDELPGKSNYFIGNDPKMWHTNVPTYARVKYENVYRGIDLVYYGNQGKLEYDFVVAPGADPSSIRFAVASSTPVRVDRDGALTIDTTVGEVRLLKPVVHQGSPDFQSVDGRYILESNNQVSFKVGAYDRTKPLIIDPLLIYSTTFSGDLWTCCSIAADSLGSAYLVGVTYSTDFPTTPGVFQATPSDSGYLFVVRKVEPEGTGLVYSTYLGGTGDDYYNPPNVALAVDGVGSAYITGYTRSAVFPTTTGAFQRIRRGGSDAFISKLDPTGSSLVYSTYLGGSDGVGEGENTNPPIGAIALDAAGNAYVTGYTWSPDFPITAGAFQATKSGSEDVFVTKLNASGSAVVYSTFLGGECTDWAVGISVDGAGNAYVTGSSWCGIPNVVEYGDFFVKLNATGTGVVYAISGLSGAFAVDAPGNAYIAGRAGSDFHATAGAFQSANGGGSDAVITKLNPAGFVVYATYLGGLGDDYSSSVAADAAGNAYVAGNAGPGFPITQEGVQGPGFIAKLNSLGSVLLYSMYLDQGPSGIAIDATGNAYVMAGNVVKKFGAVTGPGASLDPLSLSFGAQTVDTRSAPRGVTLTNGDSHPLTVFSIALRGADVADFAETHNCPINTSIPAGGQCTIAVTFAPTLAGSRSASIAVSDSSGNVRTVSLFGTGKAPVAGVSFSPTSLQFGDQSLGVASLPQTVTVKSTGTAPLNIFNIATSGTNSSDITATSDCPITPGTLAPGSDCTVSVTFKPGALGLRGGGVSLADNAPGSPHGFGVTGWGVGPMVSLSRWGYSFDGQMVGTISVARTATVMNYGNKALSISSIAVTGSNVEDFPETSNCPISPATLAPGASCAITISFKPTAAGARSATLAITDNASGSPQTITLTGIGTTRPILSAQITGKTKAGTVMTLTVTFKNTGLQTARNVRLQQVTVRTLAGNGNVTYVGPPLPLGVGDIAVGSSKPYSLQVNVPATVTKFSVTEAGTFQDAASKSYGFSLGQVVFP